MAECIRKNPGTIGYLETSHGHSEESLGEIRLLNSYGTYLSSKEAALRGGIAAAADNAALPASFKADFSGISYLNMVREQEI